MLRQVRGLIGNENLIFVPQNIYGINAGARSARIPSPQPSSEPGLSRQLGAGVHLALRRDAGASTPAFYLITSNQRGAGAMPISVNNEPSQRLQIFTDERSARCQSAIDEFKASLHEPLSDFESSCDALRKALTHMGPRDRFYDLFRHASKTQLLDLTATLIIVAEGRAAGKSDEELAKVLPAADHLSIDERAGEALGCFLAQIGDKNVESVVSTIVRRSLYSARGGHTEDFRHHECAGLMRFADTVPLLGGLNISYAFAQRWHIPKVLNQDTSANLTSADLRCGSLHHAVLERADLRNLDLSGRNLAGADLSHANVQDVDLSRANLKEASLAGVALERVNLSNADLRNALLVSAKLQGVNLSGADLREAVLRGCDLRGADLRGADLRGVDLSTVDLRGANLSGANLQGALLFGAQLQDADLSGANLQDANLHGLNRYEVNYNKYDPRLHLRPANLQGAILKGANLRGADLREVCLERADLSNANLQNALLDQALLSDANLQGVELLGNGLEYAIVVGARLEGCKLHDLSLLWGRANLHKAVLPIDPREAAHSFRREFGQRVRGTRHFDVYFNHRNNDGRSVLTSIASLDDSCRPQKIALMKAVVDRLDAMRHNQLWHLVSLTPSLGDVLFQDPEYLKGDDEFAAWLLDSLLGDGEDLLDERLSDAALQEVGHHAARLLERGDLGEISKRSVAIFQVLHEMRGRAQSDALTLEEREGWKSHAETLHRQYCAVLSVQLPSLMDQHGVYASECAVLYDDDTFPLLSADGRACVMMTDAQYRQLVLGDDSGVASEGRCVWDDLRCVRAVADATYPASVVGLGEGGTRGTASTASVLDQIPLLRSARSRAGSFENHVRIFRLGGLEGAMLKRFLEALQQRDTREKMIGVDDQLALRRIFKTKYEERHGQQIHLAAAHLAELKTLWPGESDDALAFRLLCLGALYTNYASSHVFATETESPNALRYYAAALLRQGHELAPELLSRNELGDWVNRLTGASGAFTCTAVLYNTQSRRLHLLSRAVVEGNAHPLGKILDEMIPLAWR